MNKIYKVIYSKVRNCYVVVSELAKSHGKERSQRMHSGSRIAALTLAITLCLSSYALAADPVDLGNGGTATYDAQGNLIIGKDTVAEGTKAQGQNNTTIGTNSDTLRNVTEGETTKNGQPMDKDNTQLVSNEGKAADLTTSTESGGSTAVGYNNHAEGDNSTAIGNGAKITNKPITYYADADGNLSLTMPMQTVIRLLMRKRLPGTKTRMASPLRCPRCSGTGMGIRPLRPSMSIPIQKRIPIREKKSPRRK